jgi:solute carrier family 25 carnitine/acylcarnitine transporter 20/29
LYKGATPPAVGWAAIDSILLGSLHNYRLFLLRRGWTEDVPETGLKRLTLLAHGTAGLFAGITRSFVNNCSPINQILRAQGITGLWTGLTGSVAFRSNFFWMFLSFEVCRYFISDFLIAYYLLGYHERIFALAGDSL